MRLKNEAYLTALLKIKRGNKDGVFSNAKPLMMLTLIEAIEQSVMVENKILFDNEELRKLYKRVSSKSYDEECCLIRTNVRVTPFQMPFFHLNAEEYYHIKWKEELTPPRQAASPSAKYLRENVSYAYLDPELWDLLQDPQARDEFRKAIVSHYLKPDKEK